MKLRATLVAGPHPEDPERWLVYDPHNGRSYVLTATEWKAAAENRSDVELTQRLSKWGFWAEGEEPAPHRPHWKMAPLPATFNFEVHPEARFLCVGAGSCCDMGYAIPVRRDQLDQLLDHAERLALRNPLQLLPTEPGAPWTWALDNQRGCPFLQDQRCGLHETAAHPVACRVFPLSFVALGERVRVSVTHRCGCGALGQGVPLVELDLPRRIAGVTAVPHLPEVTSLDLQQTIATDLAVEFIDAQLVGTDAEMLLGLVRALGGHAGAADVPSFWARMVDDLAPRQDPLLFAGLHGRLHPARGKLTAGLKRAGLFDPAADLVAERARFVRDHLFGLRPWHAATLGGGLLALAMAIARLRAARSHPELRVQIALWEDLLADDGFRQRVTERGPSDWVGTSQLITALLAP